MNRRDCGIAGLRGNFSRDRGIAGSRDRGIAGSKNPIGDPQKNDCH